MAQQPPENMRICSAGSEDRLATQQQQQRSTSRSRTCDETELSRERGANRPQDAHAVQGLPAPPVGGTAAVGSGEPALRITEAAERGQPPALRIVPPDTAFMVPSSKPLSVHADSAALATPRGALDLASSSANSTPAPSASNTPRHPLSAPPASASRTPSAGPQAAATSAALHRSATYTVACTGTSPSVRDLTEAKLHQLGSQVLQLVAGAGGAIRTASTILSNPYMGSNAVYPSWAEPASNILAEQGGHGITTIEFSPVLMVPTLQHLVVSGLHVNMSAARWAQAELPTPYVGDPAYNEKYPLMADVCKCQLLDESPYPHLLTGDNGKLLDKDAMLVAWLIKWLAYLAKQCARGVRIFRMWAFSPDPVTRQGLQRLADAVMQDLGLLLRLADQAKEGASTEELWRVNNLDAFCRSPSYSQDAAVACVKQLRAAKSEEGMPGAAAGGASSSGSGSGGGGGAGSQQAAAQPPTDDMVMYRVSKAAHGATSSAGGTSRQDGLRELTGGVGGNYGAGMTNKVLATMTPEQQQQAQRLQMSHNGKRSAEEHGGWAWPAGCTLVTEGEFKGMVRLSPQLAASEKHEYVSPERAKQLQASGAGTERWEQYKQKEKAAAAPGATPEVQQTYKTARENAAKPGRLTAALKSPPGTGCAYDDQACPASANHTITTHHIKDIRFMSTVKIASTQSTTKLRNLSYLEALRNHDEVQSTTNKRPRDTKPGSKSFNLEEDGMTARPWVRELLLQPLHQAFLERFKADGGKL